FGADGGPGEPVEVTEPTTLFLVDRDAGAGWAHDVDWVFVDDDGDVRVERASFYPVVDGAPYVPEWNPSAWGAAWEVGSAEEPDEGELPVWEEGRSGGARAAQADPCAPPAPKLAVVVRGTHMRALRVDDFNWRRMLAARGYQVT